ncbi:MAG: OB-fold domain-containing protein [Candidatus Omnitrophica bacterium]|nr:OB-fold domain-containing protein [Candidatus Omnitrophota bacterium]MDD5352330.1 OB-fold domain-containing protein [Candidatus Omnitrophota bacterium]MDD5549928.1 OB-fold domain-containing protein [Candidatus Omnitrophota bacterium]
MIAQINGKIIQKKNDRIVLDTNGICYEVLIPSIVMSRLDEFIQDGQIKFITYHYLQVEPSKSIPVLIGFVNEIEKEFFELFITVSGIGPRAALRAINKPISIIAKGINEGDVALLCSLPGIGKQRAKEIIAKLQGKMGKFGLIQDEKEEAVINVAEDIKKEAMEVLSKLQYKKQEAKEMIEKAISRCPDIKSTEELLNEVYRQKTK